jgi:hypothetical protein
VALTNSQQREGQPPAGHQLRQQHHCGGRLAWYSVSVAWAAAKQTASAW